VTSSAAIELVVLMNQKERPERQKHMQQTQDADGSRTVTFFSAVVAARDVYSSQLAGQQSKGASSTTALLGAYIALSRSFFLIAGQGKVFPSKICGGC